MADPKHDLEGDAHEDKPVATAFGAVSDPVVNEGHNMLNTQPRKLRGTARWQDIEDDVDPSCLPPSV